LHSRADLIRASQEDYLSYREVNAFMARALLRFRKTDSAFWIQDYHFLALGAELRDLGVTQPIGFFLHTPWPSRAVISGVPHQGVRPDVDAASAAFAHGVAAADRDALARRDRGLWQSAERGCQARQRRQRPAWRGRLDADPLSQQGLRPGRARGPLSHRAGR